MPAVAPVEEHADVVHRGHSHSQRFAAGGAAGVSDLAAMMHRVEHDHPEAVGVGSQEGLPLGRTALTGSIKITVVQGFQKLECLGAEILEGFEGFVQSW